MQEKNARAVRGRHGQPDRPAPGGDDPQGRFDEVFFVDLPYDEERIEIFKIHLKRRGLDPARYNIAQLTEFTKDGRARRSSSAWYRL